eukprot:scaffold1629_cov369-Prasinococcus_capsulatus_cf.AAC.38
MPMLTLRARRRNPGMLVSRPARGRMAARGRLGKARMLACLVACRPTCPPGEGLGPSLMTRPLLTAERTLSKIACEWGLGGCRARSSPARPSTLLLRKVTPKLGVVSPGAVVKSHSELLGL